MTYVERIELEYEREVAQAEARDQERTVARAIGAWCEDCDGPIEACEDEHAEVVGASAPAMVRAAHRPASWQRTLDTIGYR
jgi:hypothetical protein